MLVHAAGPGCCCRPPAPSPPPPLSPARRLLLRPPRSSVWVWRGARGRAAETPPPPPPPPPFRGVRARPSASPTIPAQCAGARLFSWGAGDLHLTAALLAAQCYRSTTVLHLLGPQDPVPCRSGPQGILALAPGFSWLPVSAHLFPFGSADPVPSTCPGTIALRRGQASLVSMPPPNLLGFRAAHIEEGQRGRKVGTITRCPRPGL